MAHIQDVLLTQPRAHWLALLSRARVPAGPINRIDDVAEDLELQRRRVLYRLEADGRQIPQVGTGFCLDGNANIPRLPPPKLGEHTYAVLGEMLGTDDHRLAALSAAGIIAGAAE